MAVAMEVSSWRGPPEVSDSGTSSPVRKKRAWGADAQQLMQLMMNQLQHSPSETSELTLDLLGNAAAAAAASAASPSSERQLSPEFVPLDPADTLPLPSGWEKCLDLQTGELFYVNKSLRVSTFNDPRKRQRRTRSREFYNRIPVEIELPATATAIVVGQEPEPPQVAHEFLASKKSETESFHLKGGEHEIAAAGGYSTSSSSGSPPLQPRSNGVTRPSPQSQQEEQQQLQPQHQQLQPQQQQQYPQQLQHRWSSLNHCSYFAVMSSPPGSRGAAATVALCDDSHLELDLNLSAGGGGLQSSRRRSTSPHVSPQAVCTMEMVQEALRRSSENHNNNNVSVKREVVTVVAPPRLKQQQQAMKGSGSSSFSSLTNSATGSEPSQASPAASSSSSASSRSLAKALSSAGVCEAESIKAETVTDPPPALVMGACTRCLMYVMLNKADPRCPRCDNKVPVDFVPPCTRPTGGLKLGLGSN